MMNELLVWMSVRGEGSLPSFRSMVNRLAPQRGSGIARHRIAQWHLSQLGHAEFGEAAGGGWRIAPTVLAAGDPRQSARAVLCGARTPDIVSQLLSHAGTMVSAAPQDQAPETVSITGSLPGELISLSHDCSIPVQWNAPLAILGSATTPAETRLTPKELPVGNGWTVSRFSKSGLTWVPSRLQEAQQAARGLFQFKSDYGSETVLKEGGETFAVDPLLGKYRILTKRNRPIHFDAASTTLSVPVTCRPPALVERALVVCSGRLPAVRDGWLIYSSVSAYVAEAAAALLDQRLH